MGIASTRFESSPLAARALKAIQPLVPVARHAELVTRDLAKQSLRAQADFTHRGWHL